MSRKVTKPVKGTRLNFVQHGSFQIKVNDCLLINPESNTADPFIGKVKEIVQTQANAEEVKVLVAWFYRPEEAVGGRKAFHGEKELFSSDHLDWCHKHTVIGKCRVHNLKKYQGLVQVTDNDFFSRFTYKPAVKEFEPDRVPVFCKCEMPYNPDKFMVMCEKCEEWYHPECLQLSRAAVEKSTVFICLECKKSGVGSIKRQNTGGSATSQLQAGQAGTYRTPVGLSCR